MPAALERTFTKAGKTAVTTDAATATWLLSEGWTESGAGTLYVPPPSPQSIEARLAAVEVTTRDAGHLDSTTPGVSTDYVNGAGNTVPVGPFTITKERDDTKLLIDVRGSGYALTAGINMVFGIQFPGPINRQVGSNFFNTASDHREFSGMAEFSGIPAGSYSCWPYMIPSGGNARTDNNDPWSCRVREVGALALPTAPAPPAWVDTLETRMADLEADTGWLVPSLTSGWVDYGTTWVPSGFRRIAGIVYMKGLIKSGTVTNGTPIFTLPAGFRPVGDLHLGVPTGGGFGYINVHGGSSGLVNVDSFPSNAWVSLSGYCWPADN